MKLQKVIATLVPYFRSENVRFLVIGGLALQAYGRARLTFDADFILESSDQDRVIAHLERRGFETLHRSSGYSNHLHPDRALGRVDVVWVDAATAEKLFASARDLLVIGDDTLPVPKPEHLIATKAFAIRNDPSRRFEDMADIAMLYRLEGVDRDEVRQIFEQYELTELHDELTRE